MDSTIMIKGLTYLVPLALGWVILSLLYWKIVYPFIEDRILFEVYEARDELRRSAIEGEIDPGTRNYAYLEQRFCSRIYHCGITTWRFLKFYFGGDSSMSSELQDFRATATEHEQQLLHKSSVLFLAMMFANSPAIFMVSILIVLLGWGKTHLDSILEDSIPAFEQKVYRHSHVAPQTH